MLLVYCSRAEVEPFLNTVRTHSDREKNALGFLPAGVYEEAAQRGKLFVATDDGQYAGHLLFGGTFPPARIFQLFVRPECRTKGVATLLIRRLESLLEQIGFLTITASVATDLPANGFWERAGFSILRTKSGGISRGRTINVRVKDLDTPHLFNRDRATPEELSIVSRYVAPTPVYVLDLNVFWDIVRNRPRVEYAAAVIAAALDNFIRVAVTSEFANELKRNTRSGESDPALEFAVQLPALPIPPIETISQITTQLAALVFPNRLYTGALSIQDRSDLVHLATAIHHHATGFVTSEQAMVRCAADIFNNFGLEVLHVKDFAAALQSRKAPIGTVQARVSGDTLRMWDLLGTDNSLVNSFLEATEADNRFRSELTTDCLSNPHLKRVAITSETDPVCLAAWDSRAGLQSNCTAKILTNEDHPAAETALDCLLDRIATDVSALGPVRLQLALPSGSGITRKSALIHGFET